MQLTLITWFLYCKFTSFPFMITKYYEKRYFETIQLSYFYLNFHPLILASIGRSCLLLWLLWCSKLFSIFLIPCTFINWNSSLRKTCNFTDSHLKSVVVIPSLLLFSLKHRWRKKWKFGLLQRCNCFGCAVEMGWEWFVHFPSNDQTLISIQSIVWGTVKKRKMHRKSQRGW